MIQVIDQKINARGLGASIAAACLGVSPWMSPIGAWMLLTGRTTSKASQASEWGHILEPVIRGYYAARNGFDKPGQIEIAVPVDSIYHPSIPWLRATPDGSTRRAAPSWRAGPPTPPTPRRPPRSRPRPDMHLHPHSLPRRRRSTDHAPGLIAGPGQAEAAKFIRERLRTGDHVSAGAAQRFDVGATIVLDRKFYTVTGRRGRNVCLRGARGGQVDLCPQAIGMGYHYRCRHEFILFVEKGTRRLADLGIANILTSKRIVGGYPTEKPVDVHRTLIEQSTRPGELVVDAFMGSGSAGVAAVECDRSFMGNDLSADAVSLALSRMPGAIVVPDAPLYVEPGQLALFGGVA